MTEAEWLTCTDPKAMLAFVSGTASDRKLRLLATNCVRQIHHFCWPGADVPGLVDAGESFAEGRVSRYELREAPGQLSERGGIFSRWPLMWAELAVLGHPY
jgi:hypothetical protein